MYALRNIEERLYLCLLDTSQLHKQFIPLWGAFSGISAKLRKTTSSFVISVRPSVSVERLRDH